MIEEEDLEEQQQPEEGLPADPTIWPGAQAKQAAFLTALVICGGNKVKAARAARISRTLHYRWHRDDANYRGLFADAELQAAEILEDEARRRAHKGLREPVFWQGEICGYKQVYSDSLMQFLLRGAKPEKYRERHTVTGKDGGPIEGKIEIVFVSPNRDVAPS